MSTRGKGTRSGGAERRPSKAPRSKAPSRSGAAPRSKGGGRPKAPGRAKGAGAAASSSRGSRQAPAKRSSDTRGRPGRPPQKRKVDRGLGGTQVEGRHAVRELLLAGRRRASEVLIASEMDAADILDDIVELANDLKVPVREISRRRHDSEAHTDASQGVIARAAPLPETSIEDLARATSPFLIAVDGVTDPGNLGALIRTAECAGVTGIVLPRHRAVHVTPTVTKAAAGAVEHVPMAVVGGLPAALAKLSAAGVWIVGLDAAGETSLHDLALGNEPVCLVLGAEGSGLSRLVRSRCDTVVHIPLRGRLSSLNVATASALGCYEVVRRRGDATVSE